MMYIEVLLSLVLLIVLAAIVISTILIPLYRLFTFKNKVTYIKDKYFESKIWATIFIIAFIMLIFLTIANIMDLFSEISLNSNYLVIIRSLKILIPIYAILYAIIQLPKQCIYKEGIKTNLFFIKWDEVERIEQEGNDLKIYYNYRYLFFNVRHIYTIKDFSPEIKEIITSFKINNKG